MSSGGYMSENLTRKQFLALLGFGAISSLTLKKSMAEVLMNESNEYPFYAGTYTDGKSKGIYYCNMIRKNGELTVKNSTGGILNPSFLTFDRDKKFLYSVSETNNYDGKPGGSVDSYRIDPESGELSYLNTRPSYGGAPCYISVDQTNHFVMVANYFGGNVTIYPIQEDGSLGKRSDFVQYHGKGINPRRQKQPHAHCILPSPDNRFVLSADLGTDKVRIFRFDDKNGKIKPARKPYVRVKSGSGPRHIRFHPNTKWVYVLSEMASTLTVFNYNTEKGELTEKQTVSMLPTDFIGENTAAELQITSDGKFLYASNRGDNSIVVFSINPEKGELSLIQHESSFGKIPRHFTLDPDEKHLVVANKNSNNIVVFDRDAQTGKIKPNGQSIEMPSPVCVQFL